VVPSSGPAAGGYVVTCTGAHFQVKHQTLHPQHSTLNTQHSTLNTQHSTLHPKHFTLNNKQ